MDAFLTNWLSSRSKFYIQYRYMDNVALLVQRLFYNSTLASYKDTEYSYIFVAKYIYSVYMYIFQ
jgi:hypothetical protein